ncbi:MAG: methylmalonyl Co-A mutase-associated GTPase MeaB [Actinomycetota bacterium]
MTATAEMAAALGTGDRRTLARAITLIESTRNSDRAAADALLDAVLPTTGGALRLGITGTPGVGKSTFIDAFGMMLANLGRRVAVLAVDPTSSRNGGSILGDKTRMATLSREPTAFIRPSPSGGLTGGVARRTHETLLACEAAGFDVVIVETMGVGQAETAVADITDVFLLLVAPGGGDDLQGIKRGIMELADVVAVNKADGELASAARHTAADYRSALHLVRPKWSGSPTPVVPCSALTRDGLDAVWATIDEFHGALAGDGRLAALRADQAEVHLRQQLDGLLADQLRSVPAFAARWPELEAAVRANERTPGSAARALMAEALPHLLDPPARS